MATEIRIGESYLDIEWLSECLLDGGLDPDESYMRVRCEYVNSIYIFIPWLDFVTSVGLPEWRDIEADCFPLTAEMLAQVSEQVEVSNIPKGRWLVDTMRYALTAYSYPAVEILS